MYNIFISSKKISYIENFIKDINILVDKFYINQNGSGCICAQTQNIENIIPKKYMMNNISSKISYDSLIHILNTVTTSELSYLLFIVHESEYKQLLGDYYDDIAVIIKILSFFAEPQKYNDVNYVKKIYNNIIMIDQFKNKYNCCTEQDVYFITILKTLLPIINKYPDDSTIFADVLYNFDKYDIDINNSSENIFKYITNKFNHIHDDRYNESENDLFDCPPLTENDIKLFDIGLGIIKTTKQEENELRVKVKQEEDAYYKSKKSNKTKIHFPVELNNIKDKNLSNIVEAYKKYVKYKLKYLQLKNND